MSSPDPARQHGAATAAATAATVTARAIYDTVANIIILIIISIACLARVSFPHAAPTSRFSGANTATVVPFADPPPT